MPINPADHPRVCASLVKSGKFFWMAFLCRGRCAAPPGVHLMGVAGDRRKASKSGLGALHDRIKPFRRLEGCGTIWTHLDNVRDFEIDGFEPGGAPKPDGTFLASSLSLIRARQSREAKSWVGCAIPPKPPVTL